jgi:beta-barrel assembly-enhancing protease
MGLQRGVHVWIILALIFFFLTGTITPTAYGLTTEEEKNLGKQVFSEIEKTGTLLNDLSLLGFVNRIGMSLVAEVGSTPFEFRFYLVKSQEPNAFAIPGGYIFVTTGLLVLAESEQEVAGVLSHEIAHVTMRHISQLIDRSKRINLASMAAMIAGLLLAGGGGQGGEAIAATAMAAQQSLMLKYTREHETDADQNSLHYLTKAGYDPNGLLSFLKKISRYSMGAAPKIPAYLLTHPAPEDRIALMENLIQIEPKNPGALKTVGNYKWIQTMAFVDEREPLVAVTQFESVVKSDPQDLVGLFGLGLAYRKAGRLDRSIDAFEKALSMLPDEPGLLRELGVSYFLAGKVDQAIGSLEHLRSLPPTEGGQKASLLTLFYLGRAYQEKGDFSRAADLLQTVRKEVPDFVDVYHSLGSVYGRMGNKGKSHFYFGMYFRLRGDPNSALLHFRTSLEGLDKDSPERVEAQRQIKELTPGKPQK